MNPETVNSLRGVRKYDFLDPTVLSKISSLEILARGVVEGSFSGMHKSPHRGSSVEFAQFRKYVQGDDIRNIDWKIYAKTDRFYIKEFEADTNLRCHLVIDCSASMKFSGRCISKFDYSRKLAANIAHLLVRQGDAVGLQCFSDKLIHDIPARGSPRHLRNIFEILTKVRPEGKTEIVKVLHDLAEKIKRRAMIIVFSDFFTDVDEVLDCFQHMRFRKHDLSVFHLLAPEELEFSFDRAIRFVDLEKQAAFLTEPSMIRNDYLRELDSYLGKISRGCAEFNVDYRFVNVSRPYDEVLTEYLQRG